MSEMVERVARVLAFGNPDRLVNIPLKPKPMRAWECEVDLARRVIEAMRNDVPTAMRLCGAITIASKWDVPNYRASDVAIDAWEAMIDEALE